MRSLEVVGEDGVLLVSDGLGRSIEGLYAGGGVPPQQDLLQYAQQHHGSSNPVLGADLLS